MVIGMLEAFLGGFLVVLMMMIVLFRSVLWGVLSMIPLTVTVGLIYGLTGILGKDYDMPVAVLSSLSLGLAVDYAIHFLSRTRQAVASHGTWEKARSAVFGEPARAISRNAVVVGLGFLPLILAPLVPYQTVGILIAGILLAAGGASLVVLPALVTILQRWLFTEGVEVESARRHRSRVAFVVLGTVLLAVNIPRFGSAKFATVALVAGAVLALGMIIYRAVSRRRRPYEAEAV
jgi:uncharacterized membrane protein YdfJ with MMPL/SSD domain